MELSEIIFLYHNKACMRPKPRLCEAARFTSL